MRSIGIYEGEEYPPGILLGCASHCFAVRLNLLASFLRDDTGGNVIDMFAHTRRGDRRVCGVWSVRLCGTNFSHGRAMRAPTMECVRIDFIGMNCDALQPLRLAARATSPCTGEAF